MDASEPRLRGPHRGFGILSGSSADVAFYDLGELRRVASGAPELGGVVLSRRRHIRDRTRGQMLTSQTAGPVPRLVIGLIRFVRRQVREVDTDVVYTHHLSISVCGPRTRLLRSPAPLPADRSALLVLRSRSTRSHNPGPS